jgi:hypothetical protein
MAPEQANHRSDPLLVNPQRQRADAPKPIYSVWKWLNPREPRSRLDDPIREGEAVSPHNPAILELVEDWAMPRSHEAAKGGPARGAMPAIATIWEGHAAKERGCQRRAEAIANPTKAMKMHPAKGRLPPGYWLPPRGLR